MKRLTPKQLVAKCAEIAELTDCNNHTEALIILAGMVGHDKYRKILRHIDGIHNLEGHLTRPLAEMRREIGTELRKIAEREFMPFEYLQIKGAF